MSAPKTLSILVAVASVCGLVRVQATTWSAVYPYVQKTEGGRVICRSVPYGVRDGPHGLGETFVYREGKLLYSIDKYFPSVLFTHAGGKYLVHVLATVAYPKPYPMIDEDGRSVNEVSEADGEVVQFFENGVLFKTLQFSELGIDRKMIHVNEAAHWYTWKYAAAPGVGGLGARMSEHAAFQQGDTLCLITADDQLIKMHIPTGAIVQRTTASTILAAMDWRPERIERKFHRVRYPEKFFLPPLADGRSLAQGIGDLLGRVPLQEHQRDADFELYVHTLLINDQSSCELAHITVTLKDPGSDRKAAEDRILVWIKEQRFDTRSIPKGFRKFKYSGFIYLDSPRSGP